MRIAPSALAARLAQGFQRTYLLFGAEPLLVEECAQAIRQAARNAGIDEVLRYTAGVDLDWQQVMAGTLAQSLFSSRRLLEIRLPSGKPGEAGARALTEFLATDNPDIILVLIAGRVDKSSQSAKWFKALEAAGVAIEARPLTAEQLPGWIDQRLRAQGLRPSAGAVQRLAHFSEGNLLAAAQEISKLPLLVGAGSSLDEDRLEQLIADQARFTVFTLADAALAGNAARTLRVLHGLRREGVEAVLVVWALAREMRSLAAMADELASGRARADVYRRHRVWRSRTACVGAALARFSAADWSRLLARLARADRALKGRSQVVGGIWVELERVALAVCGITTVDQRNPL
ncbi:MAG: DNA polymerase III subunit delta [Arenicellales bacterium]|nr:DNA polymerase III subunit delta [Arenicellales bacterium]